MRTRLFRGTPLRSFGYRYLWKSVQNVSSQHRSWYIPRCYITEPTNLSLQSSFSAKNFFLVSFNARPSSSCPVIKIWYRSFGSRKTGGEAWGIHTGIIVVFPVFKRYLHVYWAMFKSICEREVARSARVSSWDHSGQNEDAFVILPGQSCTLADIEGPGAITHLWFVQVCRKILGPSLYPYSKSGAALMSTSSGLGVSYEVNDPDLYRKVILKITWDNQEHPSVLAPLGDFFCVGHSIASNFDSMPFTVSTKPTENMKFGGNAALNCYLTMPFNERAKVEVVNEGEEPYIQYFYIDYDLYPEPLDTKKMLYFHAHWKRKSPTAGWAPNDMQTNSLETMVPNLDGKDNYVLLETEGAGHYIGCNHSVYHYQGTWWGEGDDMIFIDDDTWPPSMHGTGGEDYFTQGWGMQKNAFPLAGSIIHESDMPHYQVSYRWHLPDPVRFNQRIKVTLEHGHANHLTDDWSTTAYWYQTLPGPQLSLPTVTHRLPPRAELKAPNLSEEERPPLDSLRKDMINQRKERFEEFMKDRSKWMERRAEESQQRALKNIEYDRDVRKRFTISL